tara:strand:- start:6126 stop:7250 length:1125 start_codon:yes stop_codon:yes gene_type:complete
VKELYLDNAATTPVWKSVVKVMSKIYEKDYGNPSSLHKKGEDAEKELNNARKFLADEIGAKPEEIYFTTGGTESNNVSLRAEAKTKPHKRDRVVISAIEHPSVDEVANYLEGMKYSVVRIPVDRNGKIDMGKLEDELRKNGKKIMVVSIMHVNNVFGSVQDLEFVGRLCKKYGVLFHSDCVQSFGKLKINVNKFNLGLLSASAHKIGGPRGVGFLYIRKDLKIAPWLYGGGQERGLRSGTENVAGAVGFAAALKEQKKVNIDKVKRIKDYLIKELEGIGGKINGSKSGIWNNVNCLFPVGGEELVIWLSERGTYISTGSACESKKDDSRVLRALKLSKKEAKKSVRISLSGREKKSDIERVVREIKKALKMLKI